ncbi:hypothetical protein [Hansschlegelia zhihuaiae]|uniref:Uncharacterized protein n=1 Tax=Hansschlegelia zhihuaiae TaxID=405005 RepID=A0A4Q0MNE8_9HYPH|nr:hypothetical protein [Hansschlegelia zhihuaiae]RXF75417.1 hypothetical protein EK403_00740 [Hansschlegelia zhihuaiae]
MTDPADIVIVSSPLQYMNAVEQRAATGGRPADLVIVGDRHGGAAAIEALMRLKSPWRSVRRHPRRPRPSRFVPFLVRDLMDAGHRRSLEALARELSRERCGAVVIGDYRNVSQRLLAARLAADAHVLLDDGSVTPQTAAYRADRASAPEPRQFDLSWFRTRLARRAFGETALADPERLTFFTIYGPLLEGRLAPGDRIAPNAYAALREAAPAKPRGDAVWLLGSDHAEAGICEPQSYRRVVLGAAAALRAEGRRRIVYRPHRGERPGKAAEIAEVGAMELGLSTFPVELDYLQTGERPAMTAALASSAIDSLSVLDPELEIARIALPDDYLKKRADHIRAVVLAHDAFNPRLRVIAPEPVAAP